MSKLFLLLALALIVSLVAAVNEQYVVTGLDTTSTSTAADFVTKVQALLDAVTVEGSNVCPAASNTFTVVSSNGVKKWAKIKFVLSDTACIEALPAASFSAVTGTACDACVSWFNSQTDAANYAICPCDDPEYILTRSTFTLAEGKKQSDLEKLFSGEDTNKCIAAKQFINAGDHKVVLQTSSKYNDATCIAEAKTRSETDAWKAVVSSVSNTSVYNNPADCVDGSKFKACATDAKCSQVACSKGTKCTAATAANVCAGACNIKDGETEGKCNSSSIVGYALAVVAIVAAFVF